MSTQITAAAESAEAAAALLASVAHHADDWSTTVADRYKAAALGCLADCLCRLEATMPAKGAAVPA